MIRTNELKIPWIFPKENVSPQFPKREEGTTHGEQAGTIAKVANRPTNVLPPDVHLRVEPPLAEQSIEDFAANGVLTIRGGAESGQDRYTRTDDLSPFGGICNSRSLIYGYPCNASFLGITSEMQGYGNLDLWLLAPAARR